MNKLPGGYMFPENDMPKEWEDAREVAEGQKYYNPGDYPYERDWGDSGDAYADNVHSPRHYQIGNTGLEAIDIIYANLGPDGFKAYCMGNVLKYVLRAYQKAGAEDLRKARVYLDWVIDGLPDPEVGEGV